MGAVLLVAAAIRIYLNNVTLFSGADETVYLNHTRTLFNGGSYAQIVSAFINGDPRGWLFPSPLRWSWIGATTLSCVVAGECTYHVLATLSTIAGIVAVALTWWIARQWFDDRTALIAAALVATSPLQLALGRRALADEFFCALVLASIATMLRYLQTERRSWLMAWIVATTLTFAAKEQFLLIYPLFAIVWWLHTRRISIAWILPPLLYAAVFAILARDPGAFLSVWHLTTSTMGATYPEQYQNGPPHRLLIDFIAIAPIVTVATIAAFARARREQRDVLILLGGILVLHALLATKNLRYIVSADPLMRVLTASFVGDKRWVVIGLLVNAVVELMLFRAIFITAGVYDPVTDSLLRALKMLPH